MTFRRLALPLLGMLLWIMSIHGGKFDKIDQKEKQRFQLRNGGNNEFILGISAEKKRMYSTNEIPVEYVLDISVKDINDSIKFAKDMLNRLSTRERLLGLADVHIAKESPSHGQFIVSMPEQEAISQQKDAFIALQATAQLMYENCYHRQDVSREDCTFALQKFKFTTTPLAQICSKSNKICTREDKLTKYRTPDGSCNNIKHGNQGQSFTTYGRLLRSDYLDGIKEPRRSVTKHEMPSARIISSSIINNIDSSDTKNTMSLLLWAQFIEHDMSHTAERKMLHTGETIECCSKVGTTSYPRHVHPFCFPIDVSYDDEIYSKKDITCISYVRSMHSVGPECQFGPLQQINQATHFLDGSQIYGSTSEKSSELRSFMRGKLRVSHVDGLRDFLHLSADYDKDCQNQSNDSLCFASGDSRVNVHPQITAMYIVWVREHNRIAEILNLMNPSWDDEIVFQETKRIVIGEMQHITYNEWIPEILGEKFKDYMDQDNDYDWSIDPSISNAFATAAMPAFNSLVDGNITLLDENGYTVKTLNLRNHFNNPLTVVEFGHFDKLIRGATTQPSQKLDLSYDSDILNNLFYNGKYGYDVFSLDIQRGRDHGLPSYTAYRELCGLPKVKNFEDLAPSMSKATVEALSHVYKDVNDVDLIVGGLAEVPDEDTIMGPTLSGILADQFLRARRGDRYFYTSHHQAHPFSRVQLQEIRKVSLARIFCDNGDNIRNMQSNVFRTIDDENLLVSCTSEDIPKLDYNVWISDRKKYY